MASADFCRPIDAPYDAPSSRQTDRSPRVIHATFLPYTRRIYSSILLDDYRVLKIMAFSPGWNCLVCDFCSSGRKFACGFLQIPPRGGHPCRSASGSRHQGPQRTFTSKSPISHHSRSDGACAPRAMPGAPAKNRPSVILTGGSVLLEKLRRLMPPQPSTATLPWQMPPDHAGGRLQAATPDRRAGRHTP